MADKKEGSKESQSTTAKTARGFWEFFDEIKDGLINLVKLTGKIGLGAGVVFPLIFTKDGRTMIHRLYLWTKARFGEQVGAHVFDWSSRAYHLVFRFAVTGLAVLLLLGMYAVLQYSLIVDWGQCLETMLWVVVIVNLAMLWAFIGLAPLVGSIGAAAGVLPRLAAGKSWTELFSLSLIPQALFGGVHTGLDWIDRWWRVISRINWFFSIGAIWFGLARFHKDPDVRFLAALLIPALFWAHMAYKPGPGRRHFWWWINWAIAFAAVDIPLWLNYPELKKALIPTDPAQIHTPLHWALRIAMTLIVLGQLWWIYRLAHRSVNGEKPNQGYGSMSQRQHVVNWTPVWMILVGGLVILTFWYLDHKEQWGTVVSGNLGVKVGQELNQAVGGRAFGDGSLPGEEGGLTGDGAISEIIQPTEIKRLADGGVEVTFPAAPGWCATSFFYRTTDGPIQVEVIDSTYVWLTDINGRRIDRDTGGGPWYQLPKNSPQVELRDHYLEANMMQGGLLMKHGEAQPFLVGAGSRLVWHQNKLGQSVLPEAKEECFLAINIPQTQNMRLLLEGTITVRIRPAKRNAHSTLTGARSPDLAPFSFM